MLPSILKLNPVVIKEVFGRLLSASTGPCKFCMHYPHKYALLKKKTLFLVTAVDLLVSLHTIDLSQIDLKYVVKASSLCLSESDFYTHEVLAVVLQVRRIKTF